MSVSTARPHTGMHTQWHKSLLHFMTGLADHDPDGGLLRTLVSDARTGVGGDVAALKLLVKDTAWLRIQVADKDDGGWEGTLIPRQGSLAEQAMLQGRPMLISDAATHTGRPARMGPAMVVPLGIGDRVDGALLVGRFAGAQPFTDAELDRVAGLVVPAWLALCAVRQRVAAERDCWQDRNDRLTNQLCETVATDLFARDWTAPPPRHEPKVADTHSLSEQIDQVGYRILRAVIDNGNRATDEDALVSRVLHACDTVAPGLHLTDELRFRGCSVPNIPVPLLDDIEQWLTAAIMLAGTNSDGRGARIEVETCVAPTQSIAISLSYRGSPPAEAVETRSPLRSWYQIRTRVAADPADVGTPDSAITLSWQATWPTRADDDVTRCDEVRCPTALP